jgi:hypothetical protein
MGDDKNVFTNGKVTSHLANGINLVGGHPIHYNLSE